MIKSDIEQRVEKAFNEWYDDLCIKIPLVVYENKDILYCAFMAGVTYDAHDTNTKLKPLLNQLDNIDAESD